MLEAVRKKWKENYSMLSILYNMYLHLSYINLFSLTVVKTGQGRMPYSFLSNLGCQCGSRAACWIIF